LDHLGNVPIAFEYSDPNNPIADFMAMDGCPRQARIPQSNINTANDDHTVMSQDHTSGTAQSFAPISPVEHVGALSSGPPDASVMASAQLLTIEDPNVARTTPLLFIWQWIDVALNFVEYTTVATDIGNHFARAMDVYRKNFSNGPYDPICMNKYYEKLLEDDQLEEAEEIARLAVEISERWLGPDHVESWKAKGNLAHIYHEQGRYKEARELEANTVEFFNCNETNSDPDALIFKTNLAKTLLALGCMCEAKSVCYDVAEQACQIFGDEHDITLTARFQLAKVCNGLKDFREAREILEKITIARERQQEQHGRLTSKTLRAYIELANTLQQLGHDVEAIEIQRRVEKKLRDSGAIRSMWTLEVVGSVGRLLYSLGEYVGAEHVFRNLVQ
jgi:tetratricopeptide (TPR) repeat protein